MRIGTVDNFLIFAPCVLFVITTLIQMKIFARNDEVTKLEARMTKYINDNFVRRDTYTENHNSLQEQISQIHRDVSDVKNLLISIINSHNQRN